MAMDVRIEVLTVERAADFHHVMELTSHDSHACMCTAHYTSERDTTGRAYRARMFERHAGDGYLFYEGNAPVGWCQCAPVSNGLRVPGGPGGEADGWAITCILLVPEARGRGLCDEVLRWVRADMPLRGCRRVCGVGHRAPADGEGAEFAELPAAACERAGLRLIREDPERPLYERLFSDQEADVEDLSPARC